MITAPKTSNAYLLSTWSAGVALLCLGIGLHGAGAPLLPASDESIQKPVSDDTVMVETFQPPAAAAAPEESPPEPETKEEDIEIPPLPDITPPLTPPEMVEITPLEEAPPPPPPMPMPKPVEKKPEPPKPAPTPKPAPRPATKPDTTGGNSSGSSPVPFNRAGSAGRFPDPTYPASARAAKQQGTVRLLVTVEASGIPSAVEVTTSSGSGALDSAARDTISRRWRWPAGAVRKFIIPVRFVLQ
ncbi:MAG: TonB family protein [Verrucomicrobiaceae bacterium]|nr:TonB family protein [Verrucomicrobiaceae bacterium]